MGRRSQFLARRWMRQSGRKRSDRDLEHDAAEYWDLLVRERGWAPDQLRDWLTDAWTRLLLRIP